MTSKRVWRGAPIIALGASQQRIALVNGSIDVPIKRLAGAGVFLTILLGILAGAGESSYAQQKAPAANWVISTDRFQLVHEKRQFFLVSTSVKEPQRIHVPREWLIPPQDEKDEGVDPTVSSFRYDRKVTSFPIGDGKTGIQLSSYDIMPAGSLSGAAGRDVFLIYDPATGALSPGHVDLGITKERYHEDGCFSAKMTHFLISDVDQDGLVDIGIIKEEIRCPEGDDSLEREFYEQHEVHWYLYTPDGWKRKAEESGWPDHYSELPLIGIEKSPVDFVGQVLWRSSDPSAWKYPPPYLPAYRKRLIASEVGKTPKYSPENGKSVR